MTEKTAIYQDGKLIGYCDRVTLRTDVQSFGEPDENCYRITGFVPADTPPFAVGEYYTSKTGIIFKITSKTAKEEIIAVKSLVDGEIIDGMIDTTEIMFRNSTPATAEQIAEFKLAEAIANTGLHADQIRQMLSNGKIPMAPWLALQKTAEELKKGGDLE